MTTSSGLFMSPFCCVARCTARCTARCVVRYLRVLCRFRSFAWPGPASGVSRSKGFTILEILVAVIFLAFGILSYMWLNQSSNRSAMDAYYEFLAFSLAQEPIEIYRGLGYAQLKRYLANTETPLPKYPIGTWIDIEDDPTSEVQHPPEATMFSRLIEMRQLTKDGLNAIKVTVSVQPKGQSRVEVWLSRQRVTLDSLIMEKPR